MKILKSKNNKYIIYFLLIITLVISLIPFFKIGFTCSDDLIYYSVCKRHSVLEFSKTTAEYAGRFYFILTQPFYTFIYLIDNFFARKLVQYFLLILSYILFANLSKRIFKIENLDILVFALLLCFTTIPPAIYHMPTIAYPAYFTGSFSLLIFAIILFFKYLQNNKYKYVIFSSIFFAIAVLFYEVYLIFLILFCAFVLVRNINDSKKEIFISKRFYRELLPFILIGILYLAAYVIYRQLVYIPYAMEEAVYSGTAIASNFNLKNFFSVVWNLNQAAYPTKIYQMNHSLIIANTALTESNINCFWSVLKNIDILSIINILIQLSVFILIINKIDIKFSGKKIFIAACVSYLISFLPHILLAITDKYHSALYLRGYVTTYFSYFFITLAIVLLIIGLIKIFRFNKYLKITYGIILCLLFFYSSVMINFTNNAIGSEWEKANYPFLMIDKLKNNNTFDEVPENSIIYFPEQKGNSVFETQIISESFSWRNYIRNTVGKAYYVYGDFERLERIKNKESQTIYIIDHDSLLLVPISYEELNERFN